MTTADIPACAALAASRGHRPVADQASVFERASTDERSVVMVAHHDTQVVGYGEAKWLNPVGDGRHGAPEG